MATDPKNFKNTTQLSSSAGDITPTTAAGVKALVRKLSFYNSGSSTRTVTVYLLASGGTAGTTNILAVKAIPAGKTWICGEAYQEVLEEGMKMQAIQDAGTDVNVNCSGVNIT